MFKLSLTLLNQERISHKTLKINCISNHFQHLDTKLKKNQKRKEIIKKKYSPNLKKTFLRSKTILNTPYNRKRP